MKMITLRIEEDFLEKIDQAAKEQNYQTRASFIREAVREKITEKELNELRKTIADIRGRQPRHISKQEYEQAREEAFKEVERGLRDASQ